MTPMLRAYLIGLSISLALMVVVAGAAAAIGVPEKWFGSLWTLCILIGCLAGVHVLHQEDERAQR